MISAIVLTAGKSERMGGRPKALLRLHGKTFLDLILETIQRSNVGETIVVVGHHRDLIEPIVPPTVRTIFNPNYEQGMVTSLQAGIRALNRQSLGSLLFLVDHPLADSDTIRALIEHFAPGRIVLPVFSGRRGHPVLFAADVLDEILALSPEQGANIVVRKDPSRIVQVPVTSPGILVDVDTPEDFQNLQNEHESR